MDCLNFERCGGELQFRVYRDSDGDDSVPWMVHVWLAVELITQTCACEFSEVVLDMLIKDAIEEERP